MKLLASGPWFQGPGERPHRIVLRARDNPTGLDSTSDRPGTDEYVTSFEVIRDDSGANYSQGHYFHILNMEDALLVAFEDWEKRVHDHIEQYGHLVQRGAAKCLTDEEAKAYRYIPPTA
jgi:hypothetical protein